MTDDAPHRGSETGSDEPEDQAPTGENDAADTAAPAAPVDQGPSSETLHETQPVRPVSADSAGAADSETEPVAAAEPVEPAEPVAAEDPVPPPAPEEPAITAARAGMAPPPPPASPGADVPPTYAPPALDDAPATAVFPVPGTTYVENPPVDPPNDTAAARPESAGISGALAAIGAGLLGAGAMIAVVRGRSGDGDLDWSVYGSGLAAVIGMLLFSLVAAAAARRTAPTGARADLVTWPGVVGTLGLALLLPVGLADSDLDAGQLAYLVGGVITLCGVLGYLLARRAAFAVLTVLGLGIAYAQGFSDLFGDSIDGNEASTWVALAVTAFVTLVTLIGWIFPSRAITGVAVGVVGVVGILGSLTSLLVMRWVAELFSGPGMAGMAELFLGGLGDMGGDMGSDLGGDMGGDITGGLTSWSAAPADYEGDVGVILAFAAGLVLLWALAAIVSNHSGFKVLAIAMLATAVPMGTAVLAVQHPTWWIVALALVGAVVLVVGIPLARRKARAVPKTTTV